VLCYPYFVTTSRSTARIEALHTVDHSRVLLLLSMRVDLIGKSRAQQGDVTASGVGGSWGGRLWGGTLLV